MKIAIKKLHPEARVPSYAHPGDAGFDLYAIEQTTLLPGDRGAVATGIALEIPEGYVGLVWDKSGLSFNHGLKTIGGVIDAGYRGEIKIGLINTSGQEYTIKKGDKVAQMLIQKIERVEFEETEDLSSTSRAENGFGSTGKS